MHRRRMLWRIYPSYLLITVVSVVAVAWYADRQFRQFYLKQTVATLTAQARLFEDYVRQGGGLADAGRLDGLCKELGKRASVRLTVIRPDGVVLGDTEHDPGTMDNHSDRPEVRAALGGEVGWQIRHSDTLNEQMMYVAVPAQQNGKNLAVVRAAISLASFESALGVMYGRIALGGLLIAALGAVVCWLVSKRITRPLEELRRGVDRFGRGELDRKLSVPDTEEMAALAEAMNEMAATIGRRMWTIAEQRSELEAVFDAMAEGVLAMDLEERVIHMNRAAEAIVGFAAAAAKGRFIQEVARNPDLQNFVRNALTNDGPVEGDIAWHGTEDRFFQARGTALRDAGGRKVGSLVVLNEVTRLYRLERVRRDFVANVSHEMQTPITSIYGYAETLLDEGSRTEEMTAKAAQAIVRQAGRLSSLVDDLLELSRIEKQAEAKEIPLAPGSVRAVLHAAVETCRTGAAERGVAIELICPQDAEADIHTELLERAVVNLLDNATKYSEADKTVTLECEATEREIVIRVRDQGWGIAREHLPRLFERFYRVDKARSRAMGGTGLGLAIVKHIVLAHRGTVSVESTIGQGSVFTIRLPRVE